MVSFRCRLILSAERLANATTGDWAGYVTVAAKRKDVDCHHCSEDHAFGNCLKGEKKDV